MPSTSGMKGDGFYDANSSGQRAAVDVLQPWIDQAAERLASPESGRPLAIADYGSSEGKNSLRSTGRAIDAVRRRGIANPICALFSDLPTNNFNQLFRNLSEDGKLPGTAGGVFLAAVGGSFYEALMPPTTIHLAMSFNAVLWLDHLPPEPLDEFIVFLGPRSHRADVRIRHATAVAFQHRAAVDFERFVRSRASELAAGGQLLIAQPASDATYCTGQGLYDLMHDACLDLIRTGQLDQTAYARVTMPIYFRSLDEMLAPVDAATGPLRHEFEIVRAEMQEVAVPFATEFARTGDTTTYADRYVSFAQAFSEPVLRRARPESRPRNRPGYLPTDEGTPYGRPCTLRVSLPASRRAAIAALRGLILGRVPQGETLPAAQGPDRDTP